MSANRRETRARPSCVHARAAPGRGAGRARARAGTRSPCAHQRSRALASSFAILRPYNRPYTACSPSGSSTHTELARVPGRESGCPGSGESPRTISAQAQRRPARRVTRKCGEILTSNRQDGLFGADPLFSLRMGAPTPSRLPQVGKTERSVNVSAARSCACACTRPRAD